MGKGPCREARVTVCGNTCQAARLLQTPPRGVASEGTWEGMPPRVRRAGWRPFPDAVLHPRGNGQLPGDLG